MIVDTVRNGSRNIALWSLVADPNNDPHTDNGGCPMCQGGITLANDAVSINIASYTIAHASKFVRPGPVRIASTSRGDKAVGLTGHEERPGLKQVAAIDNVQVLSNAAFCTPEQKIVLVVANDTRSVSAFAVQYKGELTTIRLSPDAVGA